MPFAGHEVRSLLTCGIGPDGHWRGTCDIHVDEAALRRHGLHPTQPTAHPQPPSPPGWWHAAAERRFR